MKPNRVLAIMILFAVESVVLSQDLKLSVMQQQLFELEDYQMRMGAQFNPSFCNLTKERIENLRSYQPAVQRIFEAVLTPGSAFAGKTYQDLGVFVDKFGSRISGSDALEKSISYIAEQMKEFGFVDVHTENATVPKWIRGEEKAQLILPRKKSLAITTLGYSIATPVEGITGDVIVVDSFETLQKRKDEVKGKIVVYNGPSPFMTLVGAAVASFYGAVAALCRSFAPMSLNTPHTGIQVYDHSVPKIPVAALSPEDADLLTRLYKAGEPIRIFLKLEVLYDEMTQSRNIIGDYRGRENPNELVVLSGHIDSWDVGQGAADDGVGVILALEAVNLLKTLQLQPRRSIRGIMFTAEEMGLYGAKSWLTRHQEDMDQYVAALESDYGCFKAMGFIFSGKREVGCILNEIMGLMSPANLTMLTQVRFMPTDVAMLSTAGVPNVVLNGNDGRYFWYHHTEADVLTAMDTKNLDTCLAVWASMAFVIADMQGTLPNSNDP